MDTTVFCTAAANGNVIQFYYKDGWRFGEPYMLAYTQNNELAILVWFLRGASNSNEGPGWRTYLAADVTAVMVLGERVGPFRSGYRRDGGEKFRNVQCAR